MTAVIVCNGSIYDYQFLHKYFENADLIIGVDGGAKHLRKFQMRPDVLLGDFDSISEEDLSYYKNNEVEIIKFPIEKDMTDTEIAVGLAIERGYGSIVIIGGIGTRLDHSLANVLILRKILNLGATGLIVNELNEISLIKDNIKIKREKDAKVTLLPISEKVDGVTTKGLYYPLSDASLRMGSSLGVSNEIIDEFAEVTIKSGLLMVIKSTAQ